MTIISGYIQFPPDLVRRIAFKFIVKPASINLRAGNASWFVEPADTLNGKKYETKKRTEIDVMEIQENVVLAPYTTFKIGGPARWFAEATSETDVLQAVDFAREQGVPLFVLGGGSNLLVSDSGFGGLVLRIALRGLREHFDGDTLVLQAEAGEDWDHLVSHAVSFDGAGIECLAGIPGTVGGTPVQNVGAYGQEVSDRILRVRAFDLHSHSFVEMSGIECEFAYRQSLFNTTAKGRFIVTRVDYSLTAGGPPTLTYPDLQRNFQNSSESPTVTQVADAVRTIRRSKGMFLVEGDPDTASAGSFFKNPIVTQEAFAAITAAVPAGTVVPQYPAPDGQVKLAAAWLVEQAGFTKGDGKGRAGISSRHTLALVNRGGATAAEVFELSEDIVARVHARFGVWLQREPVLVS
jgi:UDP-N-acetylmuramate dehydrogenase